MKVSQLLEDEMDDLHGVLLLMKHGKMTRPEAEKLSTQLKGAQFVVIGNRRNVPANLEWSEDRLTGTLKFNSSKMPGTWRSGPAAVSRGVIIHHLQSLGFSVARFAHQAAKRVVNTLNGPHIYFWGPGTPPMDPTKMEKVIGTDEYTAAQDARIKASLAKRKVTNEEKGPDEMGELVKVLTLRTTPSKISLEQAKAADAWLKQQGYRYHIGDVNGTKYFKLVTSSYKSKDYRSAKGRDERLEAESKLRGFGFKIGRGLKHVMENKDVQEYAFMQTGAICYVFFW